MSKRAQFANRWASPNVNQSRNRTTKSPTNRTGFRHAFKEDELPIIALLPLFEGTIDVDALRLMGEIKDHALPELKGKTKEHLNALLERARDSGLLTHIGLTHFAIHPALPWFLMHNLEKENVTLRKAASETRAQLRDAARRLSDILQDELIMADTPLEAEAAMSYAAETISAALRSLETFALRRSPAAVPSPGAPTRQQGQFLAYIREYMLRNHAGVAPTHAALQQFFNLTPPSVNSMLIRIERRGFIRRIPHQARGIELTIASDLIPPLDRPFKM